MTKVVVTDVRYKMALAPLRSLAAAGYDVVKCEYEETPEKLCLGFYSRYGGETARVPSDAGGLVRALDALCAGGGVVLPVGRKTLRALSERRGEAQNARFLVSPPEVLRNADDKAFVLAAARRLQIPAPETTFLSEHPSLEAMAKSARYPCIIKYRDGEALGLASHERYAIARGESGFIREYARMDKISPDPLAQDYLEGRDLGVAVVMDAMSRPVDFICYESRREYPLAGGPTCLCRTTFDRALLKSACALLSDIGFCGVAMLDFKGAADGARILEINPRVWGSAAICRVSRATFFESYVRAALGEAEPLDVETCAPRYDVGAGLRFFPQSALSFMAEAKKSGLRAAMAGSGRARDGLFSIRDPRPYFRYLINSQARAD